MVNPSIIEKTEKHIDAHLEAVIEQLGRLIAQPSVAAQKLGIDECAALVADMLGDHGLSAEIMPTGGSPVVYAEAEGKADRTLIFYNHYDVQPAEPFDLWNTPPFELTRDGDNLFGRGTADNKGNFIVRLAAIAAVKHALGYLPCNIKFLVEGEEEIGSVHLPPFIEKHRQKLAADACIWEFGGVDANDRYEQDLGMRGICYVELSVRTAKRDTHSGLGGSMFENAAWRLVWALNTLKDENERILIPGYYDNVVPPTERDLELLAAQPVSELDWYRDHYELRGFVKGMTDPVEIRRASVFEPTCTICGLTSGYQEAGTKTVQPAFALAKVDFRLVPDQTPEEVVEKLRKHLDAQGFTDIAINYLGGEAPGRTDPDHPFIKLVNDAAEAVYGHTPRVNPMIGGSGPNHAFLHYLHVPIATAGSSYPGSAAHAPNEHIRVDDFINAIKHTARVLLMYGDTD